jgi:phage major head subunit gpT-like protein
MEIVNSTPLASFFQQIEFRFQQGYQRRKMFWPQYAEEVPSSTKQNVYTWLAELPGLRKWVGPKLARNIAARAVALVNDDYEDTMEIDRNDIDDDIAGVYGRKAELMGDAGNRWGDDLVTSAIINGTSTTCFDGQNFFDTSHPVDVDDSSQGTYANLFTGRPLTQANFNYVYSQMQSVKGESGKPLEVTPTLLVVGPALREIALEITKAGLIKQLATNVAGSENVGAAAATNINMGEVTPVIVPRLVDDTAGAWYLFSTDRLKPFLFQVRKPVTPVLMIDPQNPIVFNQRKFHWGVEARGAAGVTLPFLAAKATP